MKNYIYILSAFLLFSSCKATKMIKLLNKGEVKEDTFLSEIPFEYRKGLIILKVTINEQIYDFLYDTGAPNVISKELASTLKVKPYVVNKTSDSQGKKEDIEYVILDKITVGSVNFLNTGAGIADLKRSSVIACLKIDGIIGANLMQKAIWQIDYQNQVLRLSNTLSSFDTENGKHIKFNQKLTGTPIVDVSLNGVISKDVTIDTGSNDDFGFSERTFKEFIKTDSTNKFVYGVGTTTSGIYGVGGVDTIYYSTVPTLSFGEIELKNQSANFRKNQAITIGNEFFKNYDVTYNWPEREMILTNKREYDNSSFNSFGFNFFFSEDKLIVSLLINDSEADKKGIKRGDQILLINNKDYSEMNQEKWCEVLYDDVLKTSKSIDLVILRDGEKINYHLEKENLLAQ